MNNADKSTSLMRNGCPLNSAHKCSPVSIQPPQSPQSPPITTDHGIVNHGHAYSDAAFDTHAQAGDAPRDLSELETPKVSYWSLIKDNANYRWFLMSYLVTQAGEWFTYVASIAAIEQIQTSAGITSRTSISILMSLRLLPAAVFTPIGGVLADSYDRSIILLVLDILGSLVTLLFLLAYHWRSVTALYVATALQMTVAAIYEPSHSSMVPMLVSGEDSLKKAVTVSELAWSVMASVGSSTGGFAAEYLGISACFWIDSASYFISAMLIWRVRGTYLAADKDSADKCSNNNEETPLISPSHFTKMTKEGIAYIHSKPWGPFVFLKCSACLVFGAADVLNVSFSDRDGSNDKAGGVIEGSSKRLGILFGFVGIGCFLGPVIMDRFTHMDRVESMERACMVAFLLMAIGWGGLSLCTSFLWVCAFTSVRSAGSSIVWVHSSLLLQKFSSGSMLGRVTSVEYVFATLSEAISAMAGGILQDDFGLTAEQASCLMAFVAFGTLIIWVVYLFLVRVRRDGVIIERLPLIA